MSKKDPLIIGNWKMNKTAKEAVDFVKAFNKKIKQIEYFNLAVCPPFTALDAVSKTLKRDNLELGAQDIYCKESGAFTGEVSPLMLKEFNVKYVLVGHSERRAMGESNEFVNLKLKTVLENKMQPVLCIGEPFEAREKKKHKTFVKKQLKECLKGVTKKDAKNVIVAYEPIWAISSGDTKHKPASLLQIEEMHAFIRSELLLMFDQRTAESMYVIYGGSVKPTNIREILLLSDVDGVLPGGASLTPESYLAMIENC